MSATFLHYGVPVVNRRPNMRYVESLKIWVADPTDEFGIEYVKYEDGTPFPEIMHTNPHIGYKVDNFQPHLDQADSVIFPPTQVEPGLSIAFIMKGQVIIELFVYS